MRPGDYIRREIAGLAEGVPIDMVLHCPACGLQHIDAPEPTVIDGHEYGGWTNPPHRSHLCRPEDGGCGHIWRPADVCTNGVAAIATKGKNDSPPPARHEAPPRLLALADRIDHEGLCRRALLERDGWTQEQKDRCEAGVHLRRYADLLGSGSWRIFPPRPGFSFRASTLDAVVAMAQRDEARRATHPNDKEA